MQSGSTLLPATVIGLPAGPRDAPDQAPLCVGVRSSAAWSTSERQRAIDAAVIRAYKAAGRPDPPPHIVVIEVLDGAEQDR